MRLRLVSPSFKMMTSFANVARAAASTSIYTRKDFKSSGIGSIYEK